MIVMNGICSECADGKEKRLAKRRPALCGFHYKVSQQKKSFEKNKDKPKKVYKPLKRTPLKTKTEPSGELNLFQYMWNTMEHKSFLNGEPIHEFDVSCFAHILSKAQNRFPKFKLHAPAIKLLTRYQHRQWDFSPRSDLKKDPMWNKMFELETQLKEEYKQRYGKGK